MSNETLEEEVIRLRDRVRYLERIIEMLPGHVYWQDRNNMFLGCNQEQAKSAGLALCQQIIGTTPYDYLPKMQAEVITKINSQVMATGIPQCVEEQATFIDGTIRTYLSYKLPLTDETGGIVGLLGVSLDITYQKELEKELQEARQIAEATLDKVVEVLPGNAYWKDKQGKYLGCNNEFANLLKLPERKAILGKTDYDLLEEDAIADNIVQNDKVVMEGNIEVTLEELGKNSDGKLTFYLTRKAPIYNKLNEIIGIVGVSIDITDRKKMELALIEAKERAEVADKAKSDFLTNMSHDIRTPLNGILGFTQLLELSENCPEKKEFLSTIYKSSKRLVNLLDEIIDLSKLETYGMPLQQVSFDIREVLFELRELMMAEVRLKNLEFNIAVASDVPALINGDKLRTHRILLNLLGNALKFTHQGGIYLGVSLKEIIQSQVVLIMEVKDTGIGIDKDKFEVIFNKFSRLTLANTGFYSGTGLGLYIVSKFIQDMGGTVEVASELSEGTTFTCELPFKLA